LSRSAVKEKFPQKIISAKSFSTNIFFTRVYSTGKLYIQTSQVEYCCCHFFRMSPSFQKEEKRFTGKDHLITYSTERIIPSSAQKHDVIVIE